LASLAFGFGVPKLNLVVGGLIPPFGPEPAKPELVRAFAKLPNGDGFGASEINYQIF